MIKNKPIPFFLFLTFALTWGLWIPATIVKLDGGTSVLGPDNPVGQMGRWAPGVVAILMMFLISGREGIGMIFRPIKRWRVHVGWYLFTLLFQPGLFIFAKQLDSLFGKTYEVISPLTNIDAPIAFVILVLIITALPGAFMEELGWRGFLLPRSQTKHTALTASILVGLTWGVWHIPSMVFFGNTESLQITLSVLNFIPLTILYTWLFNNTGESLLLVTLFHASQQYSNNFLGTIPTFTSDALVWVFAIVITLVEGAKHLTKHKLQYQV